MPTTSFGKQYFSYDEVCTLLGISPSTLSIYLRKGWLTSIGPVERKRYISEDSLKAFLLRQNGRKKKPLSRP